MDVQQSQRWSIFCPVVTKLKNWTRWIVMRRQLEDIVAVRGAMQVLGTLQKHPWAIVTSAWRTLAESRVTAARLPPLKVIVPANEIRNSKPDPEGSLRAAELLEITPEECLVFEDTRPGIEAGMNAGMQVVAILTVESGGCE
jgi:sugar-phosphatase